MLFRSPGLLIAIGAAVALGDVSAFAVGTLVGRHRLAARVSPAKTWEGLAGTLLGALVGFELMSFALPAWLPAWARWALPALIAAGSVWGDLTESLLKRARGVKDAGGLLPGFGGLMDRIDSLLVVLPICYVALMVLQ